MLWSIILSAVLFGVLMLEGNVVIPFDIYMWPFYLGAGWMVLRAVVGTVASGFNQPLGWTEDLNGWEITSCLMLAIWFSLQTWYPGVVPFTS